MLIIKELGSVEAMEVRQVTIVQDEDSHTYVIPAELYEKFCELDEQLHNVDEDEAEEEYSVAESKFEELFSEYRTGGDITSVVTLYAQVGYQLKF